METLFEDELILAVNKPSGIPSASLHAPDQDTCERRILSREGATGFELLHRLDTGTSGVLLFAKNSNTFKEMRAKFQERSILKRYWAWSAWAPGTTRRVKNE